MVISPSRRGAGRLSPILEILNMTPRVLTAMVLAAAATAGCAAIPRPIHGLVGPALGVGNSTEAIDEFPLGPEVPGFEGYQMRARYIVVKPGGTIRIHNHTGRPAFSYVVNTAVTQRRSDEPQLIEHKAGDLSADNDISHYWRNTSDVTARWYVVDIYKSGGNAGE
jgi:quercetin dioxygenase-like cupin family protein